LDATCSIFKVAARRVLRSSAPRHLAPMTDADYFDNHLLVVDRVNNSIRPLSYAVQLATARELLAARGTRVVAQRFNAGQEAPDVGFGDAAQVLRYRRLDAQFIACHRP
jgi:hypothetical protein